MAFEGAIHHPRRAVLAALAGASLKRTTGQRRLLFAVATSVLLLAALLPATGSAQEPLGLQARKPDIDLRGANLDVLPSRRDRNRVVTVVVQLEGKPVTLHQAEALDAGRELSEAEKTRIRALLRSRQTGLGAQLRGVGARILGTYTDTYNGIKIKVRAGELRRIAAMRGVIGLHHVTIYQIDNANTDRYLRAPQAWSNPGFTGAGVKLAVIDSGINYYHRNFAGAGAAAFAADNGTIVEPGTFPTAKVVDGHDFVGDDYNPSDSDPSNDDPQPDPDPVDCKDPNSPNVQHGSHVSGTASGTGVRSDGSTYAGPYTYAAFNNTSFRIAPGVAPEAKLMAYRVFGCDGGSDLVLDAIERAVLDHADVINMSLGSLWGNPSDPSATASDNASRAGVVVVTSAGNSAASAYITGSPGAATRVISTGALDADPSFPSVIIDMPTGSDIEGINANGDTDDLPVSGAINVFADDPVTPCDPDTGEGCEQAGTHASAYVFNGYVVGQIPVTFRGNGARIDRAKQGDAQGAPAVIMVNNSDSLPPFEGPITGVDIPFVGVNQSAGARFQTDEGGTATISEGPELTNENYRHRAPFSSGGPARLQHEIKPDVIAPGLGTFSTDGATTDMGKSLSGTSMASPSVAGLAALVVEAHPSWRPEFVKGALVGSANPDQIVPYDVRLHGSGVPVATRATRTTSFATAGDGLASLAFGYEERSNSSYSETLTFWLHNRSRTALTYRLSNSFNGSAHGAAVNVSPSTVTVPAGSQRQVQVTVSLSAAALASLPGQASGRNFLGASGAPSNLKSDEFGQGFTDLTTVAGAIKADPLTTGPTHFNVRVPWLLVPKGTSNIHDLRTSGYRSSGGTSNRTVKIGNTGLHTGTADIFAWGIDDGGNEGLRGIDIRVAGVQTLPMQQCFGVADPDDRCLVFAVNMWSQWNAASENEIDILIDLDGDGDPITATGYEYLIAGFDIGEILGVLEGVYGTFIIDLSDGSLVDFWFAAAPTDSSTVLLALPASEIGLTTAHPSGPFNDTEFAYHIEAFLYADDNPIDFPPFDIAHTGNHPSNGRRDARFDAWDPVVSSGNRTELDRNEERTFTLRVDPDRFLPREGHKGWLLVAQDDAFGEPQADTIPVGDPILD